MVAAYSMLAHKLAWFVGTFLGCFIAGPWGRARQQAPLDKAMQQLVNDVARLQGSTPPARRRSASAAGGFRAEADLCLLSCVALSACRGSHVMQLTVTTEGDAIVTVDVSSLHDDRLSPFSWP
jgi:hypothetical protein